MIWNLHCSSHFIEIDDLRFAVEHDGRSYRAAIREAVARRIGLGNAAACRREGSTSNPRPFGDKQAGESGGDEVGSMAVHTVRPRRRLHEPPQVVRQPPPIEQSRRWRWLAIAVKIQPGEIERFGVVVGRGDIESARGRHQRRQADAAAKFQQPSSGAIFNRDSLRPAQPHWPKYRPNTAAARPDRTRLRRSNRPDCGDETVPKSGPANSDAAGPTRQTAPQIRRSVRFAGCIAWADLPGHGTPRTGR